MVMAVKGYDKLDLDYGMVLDLPFDEGVGVLTHDIAKPHHLVTLTGPPTWTSTPLANLNVLSFNGAGDYFQCPAADTADLDFTEDYSLAGWVYRNASVTSSMWLARYALDTEGWETYFYTSGAHEYLTLRHHHVSLPETRDGCYSDGWATGQWWFITITRSGLYPRMYRNGEEVTVTYDVNGMRDPDSAVRKLLNCRFTENTDWFAGMGKKPRAWNRALDRVEARQLFEMERASFGV